MIGVAQRISDYLPAFAETDAASDVIHNQKPSSEFDHRSPLVAALVATVREPFAVFSHELRIVAANRSFRAIFPARFTNETDFASDDADVVHWDRSALDALQGVLEQNSTIEDLQIDLDVPVFGRRRMRLNARQARYCAGDNALLLVGLEDMTAKREEQKMILSEAHHRVANSLQIIAYLLSLKARAVQSMETRQHLHDVHHRLISVATMQRQLSVSRPDDDVELGPYLKSLCESLASSMIADDWAVEIATTAAASAIKSEVAVSFGLIVTELVINSLKHGFPDGKSGRIAVDFVGDEANWRLLVSDDGVGRPTHAPAGVRPGLGTSIVEALARSLGARVEIGTPGRGAMTVVIHPA